MKLFVLLTSVSLIFLLSGASFGQVLCVKDKTADLRSSPTLTGSYVLLQLPKNYPLQVKNEQGDFLEVSDFTGRHGWISKSAVREDSGVIVNAGTANLRNGPGVNYAVVFKAKTGVAFRVLHDHKDWLFVEHASGMKGWISKDLVWGL